MKQITIEIDDSGGFGVKTDLNLPATVFFLELVKAKLLANGFDKPIIEAPPAGFDPMGKS